jgi:hypothetical protein
VQFTDGAVRGVYEETDRRQYVVEDRERVYGVWVMPPEALATAGRVASDPKA